MQGHSCKAMKDGCSQLFWLWEGFGFTPIARTAITARCPTLFAPRSLPQAPAQAAMLPPPPERPCRVLPSPGQALLWECRRHRTTEDRSSITSCPRMETPGCSAAILRSLGILTVKRPCPPPGRVLQAATAFSGKLSEPASLHCFPTRRSSTNDEHTSQHLRVASSPEYGLCLLPA